MPLKIINDLTNSFDRYRGLAIGFLIPPVSVPKASNFLISHSDLLSLEIQNHWWVKYRTAQHLYSNSIQYKYLRSPWKAICFLPNAHWAWWHCFLTTCNSFESQNVREFMLSLCAPQPPYCWTPPAQQPRASASTRRRGKTRNDFALKVIYSIKINIRRNQYRIHYSIKFSDFSHLQVIH